ncbi:hypothetical protein JW968_00230 [Candidatus Woesearchaeota archaeon]|nr:hypothetical protein [Candidatus Woesearchaeota archaeon]
MTETEDFIFDENKRTQKLYPAIGILKGQKYFGFIIPKMVKKKFRSKDKKEYTAPVQEERACIVFDNHDFREITQDFERQQNVKFLDPPMEGFKPWSLQEIQNFITYQGVLRKQYKTLSPQDLFLKIRGKYEEYRFCQDERFNSLRALWDMGTYIYDIFDAYPYIENTGLKGTSKTKAMTISSFISFNGIVFVNPTGATIFRFVERNRPTLYLDEAEKLFTRDKKGNLLNSEIVELCNSGWQKGGKVPRLEKRGEKFVSIMHDAYCPKQFASIKGLEGALQDRCITEIFIKSPEKDKRGDSWPTDKDPDFKTIRDNLYPFALLHWKQVDAYYSSDQFGIKKEFKLTNRDWQIWKPILCIAKLISKELYLEMGQFAEELTESKNITNDLSPDSWDYKILEVLSEKLDGVQDPIPIKTIEIRGGIVLLDGEKKPSQRYIASFLNKLGFKRYFKHFRDGNAYLLSEKTFFFILQTQNIVSHLSYVSQNEEITRKNVTEEEIEGDTCDT